METQKATETDNHAELAHVTVSVDGGNPQPKAVPEGNTLVSTLKVELGVPADSVLWLVHGSKRRQYDNSETINVESGMHFEAIGGGGVS